MQTMYSIVKYNLLHISSRFSRTAYVDLLWLILWISYMMNKTQHLHWCFSVFFTNAVAPARSINKGQVGQASQPIVRGPFRQC
jgi:hypothetical protein